MRFEIDEKWRFESNASNRETQLKTSKSKKFLTLRFLNCAAGNLSMRKRLRFFGASWRKKFVPTAVYLATGTFTIENRGDFAMVILVVEDVFHWIR